MIDGQIARLITPDLIAHVDLAEPSRGLHKVLVGDDRITGCEALGIAIDPQFAGESTLIDCYPREGDLIATFAQTAERPVRVQVYWRARTMEFVQAKVATVDLHICVQTSLLESNPQVTACSRLPPGETLCLTNTASERFELASTSPPAKRDPQKESCLVHRPIHCQHGYAKRPSACQLSYVEMVHPQDARSCEIVADQAGGIRVNHRLFTGELEQDLEKGVILRARLRGLFVPRAADERLAVAAFRQLASEPPPLTT